MTHRAYTVTLWLTAVLACLLAAATGWAATFSVTAAVYTAGPLLIAAGAAAAAWQARRELRGTYVTDLDAANRREDNITR